MTDDGKPMNFHEDEGERIGRIMYKLGKLWITRKQERFGQLLFNYTRIGTRTKLGYVKDPFFYLDEDIEKDLDFALSEVEKDDE